MATASISVMTLGPQQKAVASLVQPASASATGASCVILTTSPSAALGVGQQQQPQVLSPLLPKHALLVQQKRPIAAATSEVRAAAAAAAAQQADLLRCKRRINFASANGAQPHGTGAYHAHHHHHQPASVARRNARERNRVKQVNNGFATLRQHIPASVAAALSSPTPSSGSGRQASKKLSKVETLRMAVEYIRSLQQLLDEHDGVQTTTGGQGPHTPASASPYYASDDAGHFTPSQMLGSSLSPPCSEAASSSGSPTPSYASEGSSSYAASTTVYAGNGAADAYDGYEPMSPEDEELLDAISWWQQSQ